MGINFQPSFIKILILIIFFSLHKSSYLPIGISQLNNFIHLERLMLFSLQSYSEVCSFSSGPNCYFAENIRSELYEQNINNKEENIIDDRIILDYEKEWIDLYIKSKKIGYVDSFNELNEYISNYKSYISSNSDSSQIPLPLTLRLSLTFESYDDTTIKEDIYAQPSKPVEFLTETIYIEIVGKLRLTYGEESKFKDQIKYPSKTYGIIESNNLIIKLGGKKFVCDSFFLRLRDEKLKVLNINGFSGNIKAFSMTRDINYMVDKSWIKIDLPSSKIDRLVLPGGIDVDNFRFVIETFQHLDISVHFHSKYTKNIQELIKDEDI